MYNDSAFIRNKEVIMFLFFIFTEKFIEGFPDSLKISLSILNHNIKILFLFYIITLSAIGRDSPNIDKFDSSRYNYKRARAIVISETAICAVSLYLLNDLWYKDYPRSSFHFFDDNNEWMQMDKFGHISASCTIGAIGYKSLKWCGVENKKAIWYGGSLGSTYLLAIEIMDGLSSEWGFSVGDFTANTLGSVFFMSQQFAWDEQRIKLKVSYHQTEFPRYRPDLLGSNFQQRMMKDYNGQTNWLSANIFSFLKKDSRFPKWLNIACGYGAEGMVGAFNNTATYNGMALPLFNRYRQFYISPDIDFTKIKTKSNFLKNVLYILNFIKFPAPALEYSKGKKLQFMPVYF